MKIRSFLSLAALGAVIATVACSPKDNNAIDTSATTSMGDTTMGTMGPGSMGTTGTMTDSTGAMTPDSTAGMTGQDTTKKY